MTAKELCDKVRLERGQGTKFHKDYLISLLKYNTIDIIFAIRKTTNNFFIWRTDHGNNLSLYRRYSKN